MLWILIKIVGEDEIIEMVDIHISSENVVANSNSEIKNIKAIPFDSNGNECYLKNEINNSLIFPQECYNGHYIIEYYSNSRRTSEQIIKNIGNNSEMFFEFFSKISFC